MLVCSYLLPGLWGQLDVLLCLSGRGHGGGGRRGVLLVPMGTLWPSMVVVRRE